MNHLEAISRPLSSRNKQALKSAIHKAAVKCSAGSWNDLRDRSSCRPHSQLKEIFRNCPRQSHGTASNSEAGFYSAVHKAASLTVPSRSMI